MLLVAPFYLYTVGLWVAIMAVVGVAPATVDRPVTCYITATIKSASETASLVSVGTETSCLRSYIFTHSLDAKMG